MPDKSGRYCAPRLPSVTGVRERLSVDSRQHFRNGIAQRQIARGPDVDAP
jgi:hypothetical protein